MVRPASHSQCASHTRSPRVPAAARSHTGDLLAGHPAAAPQAAPTPDRFFRWLSPRPAARWLLAQRSRAVDSDNSAPRPDASVATTTSARLPLHGARPPRPTAKTAAVSRHNLAGHKIAVGFEGC